MRVFTILAATAVLTAATVAQVQAQSFDSYDLGSNGASRQAKIDSQLQKQTNGNSSGYNANAYVVGPQHRSVAPSTHRARH
jgi:hypothetical protein